MSVRKHRAKKYIVDTMVFTADSQSVKKRVTKVFNSKAEAIEYESLLKKESAKYDEKYFYKDKDNTSKLSQLANKIKSSYKNTYATFEEFFDRWLLERESLIKQKKIKISTFINDRNKIQTHVLPHFKGIAVHKITSFHIMAWKEIIESNPKKYSFNYRKNLYISFNKVMKFAVECNYIETNPLAQTSNFEKVRTEKANKRKVIDENHFIEYLKAIKEPRFEIYVLLLYFTGMRPNEAKALRWRDIDFDRNYISISKNMVMGYIEDTTKTESSDRVILVLPKLIKRLSTLKLIESANSNDYVFKGTYKHFYLEKNKEYWKQTNYKYDLYDARHTFATFQRSKGNANDLIRKYIGHRANGTLEDVYIHYDPTMFKPLITAIEEKAYLIDVWRNENKKKLEQNDLKTPQKA